MNYGLYLSAAGALTSMHRQDVMANNLANLNTVGFKPDLAAFSARLPERLESGTSDADPQLLLERLGGGLLADPTRVNLKQGDLVATHNDLDCAIQDDGFFVIHDGKSGGAAADHLRFTRDGRFTLNQQGELVLAASGLRVMDTGDQPIRLDPQQKALINTDGSIVQGGAEVARLQISTVADKMTLSKAGDNLLRFPSGSGRSGNSRQPAVGTVHQGSIENSAVDPIMALNDMMNAAKAVQANATMMQYHDTILGQAINTFGRVS